MELADVPKKVLLLSQVSSGLVHDFSGTIQRLVSPIKHLIIEYSIIQKKHQAFIELPSVEDAVNFIVLYSAVFAKEGIVMQYSHHKQIFNGILKNRKRECNAHKVLLLTFEGVHSCLSIKQVLDLVSPYADVQRIVIFSRPDGRQALVEVAKIEGAVLAVNMLHGLEIPNLARYRLRAEFSSNVHHLVVDHDSESKWDFTRSPFPKFSPAISYIQQNIDTNANNNNNMNLHHPQSQFTNVNLCQGFMSHQISHENFGIQPPLCDQHQQNYLLEHGYPLIPTNIQADLHNVISNNKYNTQNNPNCKDINRFGMVNTNSNMESNNQNKYMNMINVDNVFTKNENCDSGVLVPQSNLSFLHNQNFGNMIPPSCDNSTFPSIVRKNDVAYTNNKTEQSKSAIVNPLKIGTDNYNNINQVEIYHTCNNNKINCEPTLHMTIQQHPGFCASPPECYNQLQNAHYYNKNGEFVPTFTNKSRYYPFINNSNNSYNGNSMSTTVTSTSKGTTCNVSHDSTTPYSHSPFYNNNNNINNNNINNNNNVNNNPGPRKHQPPPPPPPPSSSSSPSSFNPNCNNSNINNNNNNNMFFNVRTHSSLPSFPPSEFSLESQPSFAVSPSVTIDGGGNAFQRSNSLDCNNITNNNNTGNIIRNSNDALSNDESNKKIMYNFQNYHHQPPQQIQFLNGKDLSFKNKHGGQMNSIDDNS